MRIEELSVSSGAKCLQRVCAERLVVRRDCTTH
jgi:hypothetical protein